MTTRYVYDRNHVALEFTGAATTPNVRYFYGTQVDQILAQDKAGGNVSWQLTDQLGSVRALVGNDGSVRNRFEYDAFGNVVSTMVGATDDSRYRYTGREFDTETGLNYYRARYFDSFSGRFIGQDPIGFQAGDANLYKYVGNNPIIGRDPSGTDVWVENAAPGQVRLHQKIAVGNPTSQDYSSFSYALSDIVGGKGRIYYDGEQGGSITRHMTTTYAQDEKILATLLKMNGTEGGYNLSNNNCRTFSHNMFNYFKKQYSLTESSASEIGVIERNKKLTREGYPFYGSNPRGPGAHQRDR